MTLALTVERQRWLDHVDATIAAYASVAVVPVVKGNGYGFGRATLLPEAARRSSWVCVGTVHELDGVPEGLTPVVLTPHAGPSHGDVVRTVADRRDMNGLSAGDRVMVKLCSSMRRYGATRDELPGVLADAAARALHVVAVSIHLPLDGSDDERLAEIVEWLPALPPDLPLWVSHLGPEAARHLASLVDREVAVRLGTSLWHGDKSFLHLGADVIATRPVRAGDLVGYRRSPVPGDGTLAMVGCGSAHGVAPLSDGRSPFHLRRRRLTLVEPPHMHTSMVWVPDGDEVPTPGDVVDVQRPLITTFVDEVRWI